MSAGSRQGEPRLASGRTKRKDPGAHCAAGLLAGGRLDRMAQGFVSALCTTCPPGTVRSAGKLTSPSSAPITWGEVSTWSKEHELQGPPHLGVGLSDGDLLEFVRASSFFIVVEVGERHLQDGGKDKMVLSEKLVCGRQAGSGVEPGSAGPGH